LWDDRSISRTEGIDISTVSAWPVTDWAARTVVDAAKGYLVSSREMISWASTVKWPASFSGSSRRMANSSGVAAVFLSVLASPLCNFVSRMDGHGERRGRISAGRRGDGDDPLQHHAGTENGLGRKRAAMARPSRSQLLQRLLAAGGR